ncbi:MAG: ATP-binding cassette domain-containing protein [Clostridia bacterium]|nr:ATP-binding cassette domain-containing protein [Clostridia bacterium]
MIEIKNLTKKFGDIIALDNVSFEVNDGEIVGFLGPNGAGKSTTMNILTGYLSSTLGSATVDGLDILEHPNEAKKMIGFLPEQPPLYLDMTVEEYLNFIYDLKDCKLDRKKHLEEICEVVKIKDVYGRLIRNLSKGYKQRIGIAQALVGNPKVIIFDEPTVGLDPKQIVEIRNLIRTLGKNHTVILSTHILPEVQSVCDRIVIIANGKIVANEKTENISSLMDGIGRLQAQICGDTESVLSAIRKVSGVRVAQFVGKREAGSSLYLIEGEAGVDIRKPLFAALSKENYALIGLESAGASLEDVFLSLVSSKDKEKKSKKSSD